MEEDLLIQYITVCWKQITVMTQRTCNNNNRNKLHCELLFTYMAVK